MTEVLFASEDGRDAASLGNLFLTFRRNKLLSDSSVSHHEAVESDKEFPSKFGNRLPSDAASYPRRTESHAVRPRTMGLAVFLDTTLDDKLTAYLCFRGMTTFRLR